MSFAEESFAEEVIAAFLCRMYPVVIASPGAQSSIFMVARASVEMVWREPRVAPVKPGRPTSGGAQGTFAGEPGAPWVTQANAEVPCHYLTRVVCLISGAELTPRMTCSRRIVERHWTQLLGLDLTSDIKERLDALEGGRQGRGGKHDR